MWRGGFRFEHSCSRLFRLAVPHWLDHGSVSTSRSSNRTCRSPASGSRTRPHAFVWRATPSAIPEPVVEFIGCPITEAPSLHRNYPASAVLRTSPPPQGARPVPHGLPVGRRSGHALGLPVLRTLSLCTCCRHYPGAASGRIVRSFTQSCQPSPKGLSGRPAHRPFRGLLGVHSRYGLHTRAVTYS